MFQRADEMLTLVVDNCKSGWRIFVVGRFVLWKSSCIAVGPHPCLCNVAKQPLYNLFFYTLRHQRAENIITRLFSCFDLSFIWPYFFWVSIIYVSRFLIRESRPLKSSSMGDDLHSANSFLFLDSTVPIHRHKRCNPHRRSWWRLEFEMLATKFQLLQHNCEAIGLPHLSIAPIKLHLYWFGRYRASRTMRFCTLAVVHNRPNSNMPTYPEDSRAGSSLSPRKPILIDSQPWRLGALPFEVASSPSRSGSPRTRPAATPTSSKLEPIFPTQTGPMVRPTLSGRYSLPWMSSLYPRGLHTVHRHRTYPQRL